MLLKDGGLSIALWYFVKGFTISKSTTVQGPSRHTDQRHREKERHRERQMCQHDRERAIQTQTSERERERICVNTSNILTPPAKGSSTYKGVTESCFSCPSLMHLVLPRNHSISRVDWYFWSWQRLCYIHVCYNWTGKCAISRNCWNL